MKVHAIAEIWPEPSKEDFAALRAAIEREGLLVPIVTWRGEMVDGRQRMRACLDLDVAPRFESLPDAWGESRVAWHVDALHARRNLLMSQHAAIRAELMDKYGPEGAAAKVAAGGDRKSAEYLDRLPPIGGKRSDDAPPARAPTASAKAAALAPVSPRTVERASFVRHEDPEVFARMKSGEIKSVNAAVKIVKKASADAARAARVVPVAKAEALARIVQGDAVALAADLAPGSVACLITDPPYGLEVHRTRQGGQDYADGPEYAIALLRETLAAIAPALMSDAHAYVFSGYTFLDAFRDALTDAGWIVQPWPIVWVKDNHTMCDFGQWYPCKYEYVIFARREKTRSLAATVPAVITARRSDLRGDHSAAKPDDLLRTFVEQSTAKGELVLDTFAGVGSTLRAAKDLGRRAIGFEIDAVHAARAQEVIE